MEEAIANLFAEICINYQLQNKGNISYISNEENENLKARGYIKNNSYVKEGDFLRSVLIPLKSKRRDLEAIKEYLFNSKNNFINICTDVLGKRFSEILENMQNVRISTGVNDSNNYLTPSVLEEMMYILCSSIDEKEVWQKENDDSFGANKENLYSTYSTIFEQTYFWDEIKPYLEGKAITIDDIKKLRMKIGGRTRSLFSNNGVPNYMKKFVLLCYKQSLR